MKKADYLSAMGQSPAEWDIIPQEKVELLIDKNNSDKMMFPIYGIKNQIAFGKDSKTVNKQWVEEVMGVPYNEFYQDDEIEVTLKPTSIPTPPPIPAPSPIPTPPPVFKQEPVAEEKIEVVDEVEEIQQEDLEAAAEKYDEIVSENKGFLCEQEEQTGNCCPIQCKFCANAENNGNTIEEQKAEAQKQVEEQQKEIVPVPPTENEIKHYKEFLLPAFGYVFENNIWAQKHFPDDCPKFTEEQLSKIPYIELRAIFKPIEQAFKDVNYKHREFVPGKDQIPVGFTSVVKKEIEEIVEAIGAPKENVVIATIPKPEELKQTEELFPDDLPEKPELIKEKPVVENKSEDDFEAKRKERKAKIETKISKPEKVENKKEEPKINLNLLPVADDKTVERLNLADSLIDSLNAFKSYAFAVSLIRETLQQNISDKEKLEIITNSINHCK